MKEPKNYLKKAKSWNFAMLIFSCISLLLIIIGLPKSLNPDREVYQKLGSSGLEMYDYLVSFPARAYVFVNLGLLIALVVLYFLANKKMAQGIVPPKFPYYIVLGWFVVSLLYNLLVQPQQAPIEGINIALYAVILSVGSTLLMAIVPVMILINLFKAEPDATAE